MITDLPLEVVRGLKALAPTGRAVPSVLAAGIAEAADRPDLWPRLRELAQRHLRERLRARRRWLAARHRHRAGRLLRRVRGADAFRPPVELEVPSRFAELAPERRQALFEVAVAVALELQPQEVEALRRSLANAARYGREAAKVRRASAGAAARLLGLPVPAGWRVAVPAPADPSEPTTLKPVAARRESSRWAPLEREFLEG